MEIYHLEAKIVSRGAGRSAVAAAAYLSCSRMHNEYDGVQHDYTRKQGLGWRQVFLPATAPAEWQDRENLWNAVEEAETAKDSRLAREFVAALPIELSREEQIQLLQDFIKEQFVADGMCADAAIHDPYPDVIADEIEEKDDTPRREIGQADYDYVLGAVAYEAGETAEEPVRPQAVFTEIEGIPKADEIDTFVPKPVAGGQQVIVAGGQANLIPPTEESPSPHKSRGNTTAHKNFRRFQKLFPEIVSGQYDSLRLEAGDAYDPLVIHHKYGDHYCMEHYYIVIPEGDSQLTWVKWHTPSEPQDITITVRTNRGTLSQTTIKAKVVDLSGNDPPDPKATDTAGSWRSGSVPNREEKSYAAWSVWWAQWHPYWVWHRTGKNSGYWVDEGWYDFFRDNYSASMTATTRIEPDEKVPTAAGNTMKSGYGVSNTVTATVSTSAPMSHYTYGQTAVSYFPEFNYTTYWRLLDRLSSGKTVRFQFAENIYSTYKQRVHFSPVWFPDGSYTVNTHVLDIWTPAGMLCANLTDSVTISGSLYDDWHIAPGNP